MRRLAAAALALLAVAIAIALSVRARAWNDELIDVPGPLWHQPPRIADPHTPRLARRVVLVVIDGLGAGESKLPFLDELRARGTGAIARVSYPSISRPNYVTILTGVPPRDSGVRTNTVHELPRVDTIMDRAHVAGLRVDTASDYGSLASLFGRRGVTTRADTFDVVDRSESLDELGATLVERLHGDDSDLGDTVPDLTAILALDVDRAGHASGVGDDYRAAAAAVDRMLRRALDDPRAGWDFARDTIVVTADHGHVARGGHGGLEDEVMHVPLVLAGAGIVRGAVAREPRTIDIAPTVAALLGIPAPGHAEGRALVELLQLTPVEAARRAVADDERARAVTAVADAEAAADDDSRPDPLRLLAAVGVWLLALALATRRQLVALSPASALGATGFVAMLGTTALILGGHASPSFVPTLARSETYGTIGAIASVALHVAANVVAGRAARDRYAAALGAAVVGLGVSLGTLATVRAWHAPPFVDVPSPFWIVALPALELAAAACAAGVAISLIVAVSRAPSRANSA